MSTLSLAALPIARQGLLPWSPRLAQRGARLAEDLAATSPTALAEAAGALWAERLEAMGRGIAAYRAHPYRRDLPDPPSVWAEGPARLLDYGGDGPAVLCVPSLVNRGYILDLSARRSLLRFLKDQGFRPLLVDWGTPDDPALSVSDLIAGRLSRVLERAVALGGGDPVGLLGYCMGGSMATALAALHPGRVRALALLAAPWDFHAARPSAAKALSRLAPRLLRAADGFVPVDWLQVLFLANDPELTARKYALFAGLDTQSEAAAGFVAVEDWANDGVPLAVAAARECLVDWYGANRPGRGDWRIGDVAIRPESLRLPTLAAVPRDDRLVMPEQATALATAIPGAALIRPAGAHVGMVVGPEAPDLLWQPLAQWMKTHLPAPKRSPRRALRKALPAASVGA